jgi:hypothetical protein
MKDARSSASEPRPNHSGPKNIVCVEMVKGIFLWARYPCRPVSLYESNQKKSLWELVVKESGKNWRENLHLWSVWAAYTSNNGSFDRAGLEETENITVCLVFGHLI